MSDLIKKEQLPAYIKEEDRELGLQDIDRYIQPQRVKVVQKMSDSEQFGDYETGDLLLMPDKIVFANKEKKAREGNKFYFVPILFFVDYIECNPVGVDPFVRNRSTDPKSEIAKKAANPETRETAEGIRFVQNHNFVVMPYPEDSEFFGEPIVITFSRGLFKDGTRLLSLLRRRRNLGMPIFACVFEAFAAPRKNSEGDWFSIECQNPSADSGVSSQVKEEHYHLFRDLHIKFKEAAEEARLIIDHEDESLAPEVDETDM